MSSGKDLFDASLFSVRFSPLLSKEERADAKRIQSESNAAIFYTMIAELKQMSDLAEPTAFHRFLKSLDEQGKLFRVYTQCVLSSSLFAPR